MGIAGLWAEDVSAAADHRFCLLTRDADRTFAPVHNRMPVVLPRDLWTAWIDPGTADPTALLERVRLDEWEASGPPPIS